MEFKSSSVRRRRVRTQDGGFIILDQQEKVNDEADHNLSLYSAPANETISLLDFKELGLERLRVLRKLELLRESAGSEWAKFQKEAAEYIKAHARDLLPHPTNSHSADHVKEARRRDRVSHLILRLAFCQTQDHRDWFTKQETDLFRVRFFEEPIRSRLRFLELNNVEGMAELSSGEREEFAETLVETFYITESNVATTTFYKVDFERVFELFFAHKLCLRRGMAIVSVNELEALIVPQFREALIASMTHASRNIGSLHEEDRLIPMMQRMTRNETDYNERMMDAEHVTPEMIDELAATSFPLCMKMIHSNLRSEHKIRHFARQQYGLFLKGIGLSLEHSMEFFRREFTKVMDSDQFSKEYAYNIRYMYGKEGKRTEGRPLSCPSIILGTAPSKNDCHGCPFRHLELEALSRKLASLGIPKEQAQQMVDLSKSNRYDKACTRYFEHAHKMPEGGLGSLITHPNEYYSLSRKVIKGERSRDAGTAMEVDIEDIGATAPSQPTQTPEEDPFYEG